MLEASHEKLTTPEKQKVYIHCMKKGVVTVQFLRTGGGKKGKGRGKRKEKRNLQLDRI